MPSGLNELVARLHALLRHASGRSMDGVEHGVLSLTPSTGELRLAGQGVGLARRELALLRALMQHLGRIRLGEQLRDSLYGFNQDVETRAVNVHIHHLRRKRGPNILEAVRGLFYGLGPAVEGSR